MSDRAFLDVLINIFAVFVLILISVAIEAKSDGMLDVQGVIAPVEKQTDKNYIYFELFDGYAIPLTGCSEKKSDEYKYIPIDTSSYACVANVDYINTHSDVYMYGTTNSKYNSILNNANPSADYIVFLTRPSAFSNYHDIVKKAMEIGYEVGWSSVSEKQPIKFSSHGRKIGVQH